MVSLELATCTITLSAHETSISIVAAALAYVTPMAVRKQNETWRRKEGFGAEQCRAKLELSAVKQCFLFPAGIQVHPASSES